MALKLKTRTTFPASVTVAAPLLLEKTGLRYDFSIDVGGLTAQVEAGIADDFATREEIDATNAELATKRTNLSEDTTFWVRSNGDDDNDGSANTAGGAFLTWNALYNYVAENYDFNGFTVTLKSGTTNTYAAGLFMGTAWVGGGALIVDGNGCGIAETVTKGIIVNVVQPGPVSIQNFGAGISSTLGSAVQIAAPGNMYVLEGNVFGTCQNAHLEAIQGGNLFVQYDYSVTGTGAGQHAYAAYESTLVLFGEMTLLSNQTFSNATVYVEEDANIQAAGFSVDLNGFTVTGPRYVAKGGRIFTNGNGENFFPGTSAGVKSHGGTYDDELGVGNLKLPENVGMLRAKLTGVNFNSANSDNALTVPLPTGYTRWNLYGIVVGNASASLTTATIGVFSSTGGGGTAIASNQAITVSTASANTANNMQFLTGAGTPGTTAYTFTTLQVRIGTAQGSAATGDVTLLYVPVE